MTAHESCVEPHVGQQSNEREAVSLATVAPTAEPQFGAPSLWRMEAADALHLRGERLAAALSPGPAFPSALASMAKAFPPGVETLVDIGAGGAGATEYLRRRTGATAYAVEPSARARHAAQQCFPQLRIAPGSAERTGLPNACADVVTMCGVMSLIDAPEPVFSEVARLLKPTGALGVTDLYSTEADELRSGPNVFRSFDWWRREMARLGLDVVEVGCGVASPLNEWGDIADSVDRWIRRNCRHRAAFDVWMQDRRHLRRHIERGDVVAGCMVGVRELQT